MQPTPWIVRLAALGLVLIVAGVFSLVIKSLWTDSVETKAKIVGHYERSGRAKAIVARYKFKVNGIPYHGGISYSINKYSVSDIEKKHPIGKIIQISYISKSPIRNKAYYSKNNTNSWCLIVFGILLCAPLFYGKQLTKG